MKNFTILGMLLTMVCFFASAQKSEGGKAPNTDGTEANKMVVPGRTWWYWSATGYNHEIQGWEWVNLGITIGSENEKSEQGFPCYAVDSQRKMVIDEPLAYLSEENDVVTVAPNFDLSKYSTDNPSNEVIILSTFLGYWYGNELGNVKKYFPEYDCIWNKDPERKDFLLYDFSYTVGDSYLWPWSGANLNIPEMNKDLGEQEIISIEEKYIELFNGEKRKAKVFNLHPRGEEEWWKTKIIEGIGIVGRELPPYFECLGTWGGFFIAPQSVSVEPYSGSLSTPLTPILYLVEESDGTPLYLDAFTYEQASTPMITKDAEESHSPIYDLHGRRISSPLPGSIYIRDGKKFVGK